MAPIATRLIRWLKSNPVLQYKYKVNAQVMELVYVSVLEAEFCEFESHPGHQL